MALPVTPAVSTTLAVALSSDDTIIKLASVDGIELDNVLVVEQEAIAVLRVDEVTSTVHVRRGVLGTAAVAHLSGTAAYAGARDDLSVFDVAHKTLIVNTASLETDILNAVTVEEARTAEFDFTPVLTELLNAGQEVYFPDRWADPGNPNSARLPYHLSSADLPNGARIRVAKNQTMRALPTDFRGFIFRTNRSTGLSDVHISGGFWGECDIVLWQEHASGVMSHCLFENMQFSTCIDAIRASGGSVECHYRNLRGYSGVGTLIRFSGVNQSNHNRFEWVRGVDMASGMLAAHLTQVDTDGLLLGGIVMEDSNGGVNIYVANSIVNPYFENCGYDAPYTPTSPEFTPIIANGQHAHLTIAEGYFESNSGLQDISMVTDTTSATSTVESRNITIRDNVFAVVLSGTPMERRINFEGRIQFRLVDNSALTLLTAVFARVFVETAAQALAFREFDANWLQATPDAPERTYLDALFVLAGTTGTGSPATVNYRWRSKWGASIQGDGDMRWTENDWAG